MVQDTREKDISLETKNKQNQRRHRNFVLTDESDNNERAPTSSRASSNPMRDRQHPSARANIANQLQDTTW